MNFKKLIVFLVLTLSILAQDYEIENDVLILTDKNFEKAISSFEFIFVKFYAPWCGHCKKLAPEFEKAAKTLKTNNPYIPLAKIDCTTQEETATKQNIEGFPTLRLFINGTAVEFDRDVDRTESALVAWIKRKTGHSSVEITNQEQLNQLKSQHQAIVVFFGTEENKEQYDKFINISSLYERAPFAHVRSADLAKENNAQLPSIVIFKQYEEGRNDYQGSFDIEEIANFIDNHQYETILPFNERTVNYMFSNEHTAIQMMYSSKEETHKEALKALQDISQELKGKALLVAGDVEEKLGNQMFLYFQLEKTDLPKLVILKVREIANLKYVHNGPITKDSILQFFNDVEAGKIEKLIKSEKIPENNTDTVKIVVGHTFEKTVQDPTKDVFVFFFAPWCGHCKQFKPVYERVAEKLKSVNDKILFTKIDATENEFDGIEVNGYPTIAFYPANNKTNIVRYEEDRSQIDILNFLKNHTSFAWVDVEPDPIQETSEEEPQPQSVKIVKNPKKDDEGQAPETKQDQPTDSSDNKEKVEKKVDL